MNASVISAYLNKTISFEDYLQLTQDILEEKIPRLGIYSNDSTFRYTRSNLERMNRVMENIVLNQKLYNALSDLKEDWVWVVISEPWCGDASWSTPALAMIAQCSGHIEFRILLRDSNPEVMDHYHTKGSESIPKLVCVRKSSLQEVGTWGPRPEVLQRLVMEFKDSAHFDYRESVRKIHAWYAEDMTRSIQQELYELMKRWNH